MKNNPMVMIIGLVIILTWVAWRILEYVWLRPKKLEKWLRKQSFKGNNYRLWHGDLKDMNRMNADAFSKPISLTDDILPRVVPFHHHIIQKYGKKSFIWHGPTPRVHIMEPELIREILFKYNTFRKPMSQPLVSLLVSGVVFYEGEKWAKHRRILNPAFKLDNLKHMLPAIYESCSSIIEKLEKVVTENEEVEVDMWPYLGNLSADVISRTTFGSCYEEGKRIFQLQTEQSRLTFSVLQSNYISGWRFLPTKTNKRMKQIHTEVRELMKGILNKRIKLGEARNDDDLLGILMESNLREIQKFENSKLNRAGAGRQPEPGITIEELIEECKLLYFAGQETTSNLLAFTMVMLAKHKDWQTRARQEVLGNNILDFDTLNHLKIVTMILYEVLRLYPPAMTMGRKIDEVTKLGDATLPAGVELVLPIILVHHDTEIWGEDANEFKPDRFSEGVAKATKGQLASFFPFSSGPRICLGQHLALMEAKMAIAMFLQHFSFELSPSYAHAPFPILTLQPQLGVNLLLHKI
ncbi:cytochrome P450 CYP72A219-like [Lycium ferocissimum]|uniref:cytochrome P450 CYP72A219-like n=1 Tax=Lycium ferocissimum TaxID=112874 RepID=UPI00281548EB|nr:cytochrome P450 CYP72A219-like [Lycium ferocissimum]